MQTTKATKAKSGKNLIKFNSYADVLEDNYKIGQAGFLTYNSLPIGLIEGHLSTQHAGLQHTVFCP